MKLLQALLFPILFHFVSSVNVCAPGFTLVNNKCLKLFTNAVAHSEAERTCLTNGATLVTAKNAVDNRAITNFAGPSVKLLWMGLYCFGSDPAICEWDDATGSAENYNSFASGFPLLELGKCVYYSTQGALAGKWLSGDCNEARAFVCELPSTRADNCTYNYDGHCYTFHNSATFVQAQTACEQECGNLASITSPMENRYLSSHASGDYHFIGGMWPSPNVQSWIDGTLWSYNNIDPTFGQRNNTCMVISGSGLVSNLATGFWASAPCSSSYKFICKRAAGVKCNGTPPPVVVTPVPLNPSQCNSSLVIAPGVITSPNFPNNYDNNLYCIYQLTTIPSYNILLQFTSFITEQSWDVVTVYDGDSINSPVIGSFSGQTYSNVGSSGFTMTVAFRTDNSNVFPGFSANVRSFFRG